MTSNTPSPAALEVRRRVLASLGPTETPAFGSTEKPHIDPKNLADGVILVRVIPDYVRGMWFAILDVTNVEGDDNGALWAPGIVPPVLIPQASVDLVKSALDAQVADAPPPSSLWTPGQQR
jgi:hypothetical protein